MSPVAHAFARARMASRSVSMRVMVFSKQAMSSSVVFDHSLSNGLGSVTTISSFTTVTFGWWVSIALLMTGQTDLALSRPDFFIASLYNSCAANSGRHFSTPPSLPM